MDDGNRIIKNGGEHFSNFSTLSFIHSIPILPPMPVSDASSCSVIFLGGGDPPPLFVVASRFLSLSFFHSQTRETLASSSFQILFRQKLYITERFERAIWKFFQARSACSFVSSFFINRSHFKTEEQEKILHFPADCKPFFSSNSFD